MEIVSRTERERARRSENLTARQRENLGKVTHASDHLLTMINDLLDLSKIEAGRMSGAAENWCRKHST